MRILTSRWWVCHVPSRFEIWYLPYLRYLFRAVQVSKLLIYLNENTSSSTSQSRKSDSRCHATFVSVFKSKLWDFTRRVCYILQDKPSLTSALQIPSSILEAYHSSLSIRRAFYQNTNDFQHWNVIIRACALQCVCLMGMSRPSVARSSVSSRLLSRSYFKLILTRIVFPLSSSTSFLIAINLSVTFLSIPFPSESCARTSESTSLILL